MKKLNRSLEIAILLICILALNLPLLANAKGPTLGSTFITGNPPTIDGIVSQGEWPGSPQIVFDLNTPNPNNYLYVMPTYVYILNDLNNLYFLVDAVGDTVANDNDECLLAFGVGDEIFVGEVLGNGNTNSAHLCFPSGTEVTPGFGTSMNSQTLHRIYEWKIPLASIHANAGQPIDFSSPRYLKFSSQLDCPNIGTGSMPYDADAGRDNIWPPDISTYVTDNRSDWGILQLQPIFPPERVPSLSEWGLILLSLLLAASACGYLRKSKRWA